MLNLVQKYRPRALAEFCGMENAKRQLGALIAAPMPSAWILFGPSGTGKSTAAMLVHELIGGTLHHVPASQCGIDTVERLVQSCHYFPAQGQWHVILIDEADLMSTQAQSAWLSPLDNTSRLEGTVILFTCNSLKRLADRFQSRCFRVDFTTEGVLEPASALLASIWEKEAPPGRNAPDFGRIVEGAHFNIRTAVMTLEMEIESPGSFVPAPDRGITPTMTQLASALPESVEGQLDAREMANLLQVGRATIYQRVKNGLLPPARHSIERRTMVWDSAEVLACLRQQAEERKAA
ncbi:MAG: hypothetical protein NVS1B6_00170 [Steroidobacteraceae bacterium]